MVGQKEGLLGLRQRGAYLDEPIAQFAVQVLVRESQFVQQVVRQGSPAGAALDYVKNRGRTQQTVYIGDVNGQQSTKRGRCFGACNEVAARPNVGAGCIIAVLWVVKRVLHELGHCDQAVRE
jgi:hypothetical protein